MTDNGTYQETERAECATCDSQLVRYIQELADHLEKLTSAFHPGVIESRARIAKETLDCIAHYQRIKYQHDTAGHSFLSGWGGR